MTQEEADKLLLEVEAALRINVLRGLRLGVSGGGVWRRFDLLEGFKGKPDQCLDPPLHLHAAFGGVVPLHGKAMRVLRACGVVIGAGHCADPEDALGAGVGDDAIANLDVPELPDLRRCVLLFRALLELSVIYASQITEAVPSYRDEATRTALLPLLAILTGRDLPIPRLRRGGSWQLLSEHGLNCVDYRRLMVKSRERAGRCRCVCDERLVRIT